MDRAFVEGLFARHRQPVYRFLSRLIGDQAAAEDLTQDVFVRTLSAEYCADERERAWVFQIARNLARDYARRAAHRGPTLEVVDEPAPFVDAATTLQLRAALSTLAQAEREIFLMREVGGLSYAEIADACEITPDAVRNRIHRARLALRATLSSTVVQMNRARP